MRASVRVAALASALVAALASAPAQANGASWEQESRERIVTRQGPMALSSDGRWLVHVDAAHVMHRVNLADPRQATSIRLPTAVRAVAASRTGQRVALVADSGCEALVDFGSDKAPVARIGWNPSGMDDAVKPLPDRLPATGWHAWPTTPPKPCLTPSDDPVRDVLALSGNGRLLANARQVLDVEDDLVVATLPRGGEHPVLVRFVDHDTRLLTVSDVMAEGDTDDPTLDRRVTAVWDLKSGTLQSLSDERRDLRLPVTQLVDVPAGSGVVYSVTQAALAEGATDGSPGAASLVAWPIGGCAALPPRRLAVGDWRAMAVDPAGRWVAGTQTHAFPSDEAALKSPIREDLVVLDVVSGRTLLAREWPYSLHALTASPDGTRLFALAAITPVDGAQKQPGIDPRWPLGDVVTIAIPSMAPATTLHDASATTALPCPIAGESPHARDVVGDGHALQRLWTQQIDGDFSHGQPCESSQCDWLVVLRDGAIWLDRGRDAVKVDPATGRLLQTLPTPRGDKVTSVALPASDGWFNAQGDTLSWRPVDASMAGVPARRVVDRRPGFEIILLERQGDAVLAAWVPKSTEPRPDSSQPPPRPATYVFYDAQGRPVGQSRGTQDVEGEEGPGSAALQHEDAQRYAPACHDETGARSTGFDWRLGRFDSVVAWACGPAAGNARMALWADVDIRWKPDVNVPTAGVRRIVARDGALAVVFDETVLHVFDATARRVVGRIDLTSGTYFGGAAIDAPRGLVVTAAIWRPAGGPEKTILSAWSLR